MQIKQTLDNYIKQNVTPSPGNFPRYESHKKAVATIAKGDVEWYTYACKKISRRMGVWKQLKSLDYMATETPWEKHASMN